jgi:hypothetical protein
MMELLKSESPDLTENPSFQSSWSQSRKDPPSFEEDLELTQEDLEDARTPLWKRTLTLIAVLCLAYWSWGIYQDSRPLPECGPFAEPVQVSLRSPQRIMGPTGYEFEATDTYDVSGLVVSRARYRFDNQAVFCPVDLAIAWGPLTSRHALDSVQYSQSGRWYWFRVKGGTGFTNADVVFHSANKHMIPADDVVRHDLLAVRRGDQVRIQGFLVVVQGPRGLRLASSRDRKDGGAGSCEIIYVTSVEKLESAT